MENFEEIRMNAMISLTVHYPKESAQYLTSQFYEAGYTLTQRTDILNVNSEKKCIIFSNRSFLEVTR